MPYPGFPTDLQSPMMALACIADGVSVIVENVFENRFQVARELSKMGAKIVTSKKVATVFGTSGLTPATVVSPDLRGGMSLVLAALSIPEFSVIEAFEKVNRGYDRFQQKLTSLGVKIINQEDFA
jgi:UDP-N-acetylglucosamine 1-carboxyvinyltransferase